MYFKFPLITSLLHVFVGGNNTKLSEIYHIPNRGVYITYTLGCCGIYLYKIIKILFDPFSKKPLAFVAAINLETIYKNPKNLEQFTGCTSFSGSVT